MRPPLAAVALLAKLGQLAVGPGGTDALAHVESSQGADPIKAFGIPQGLVVRELQGAPRLHRLTQEAGVVVF